MTEEIINADGSRNWEANILIDNVRRLEQERDELKKACEKCKLLDIEKTNRDLLEQIDKLEQENKELKADVLKWQKAFSRQYQINENKGYSKAEENYRSALEEIREIVNQSCNNCKYNKDDITCSIGDCGEDKLKIIENKINEVTK